MSCYSNREQKKKKSSKAIQPKHQLGLNTGRHSSKKSELGATEEFKIKEKSLLSVHKRIAEVFTTVI